MAWCTTEWTLIRLAGELEPRRDVVPDFVHLARRIGGGILLLPGHVSDAAKCHSQAIVSQYLQARSVTGSEITAVP